MKHPATDAAAVPFKAGAELRRRIVEGAARLFAEHGYEQVSLRRIAQAAGCSQMAMYRHFPDKEALIRHLCAEMYARFTTRARGTLVSIADPAERIETLVRLFVRFALQHPDHYRLTFVTRYPSEDARKMRESVAGDPIDYMRDTLRQLLPAGTAAAVVEERLHQILAAMHGMTVMLISHPRAYGLTAASGLRHLQSLVRQICMAPVGQKTRTE